MYFQRGTHIVEDEGGGQVRTLINTSADVQVKCAVVQIAEYSQGIPNRLIATGAIYVAHKIRRHTGSPATSRHSVQPITVAAWYIRINK